jgi:hypothetical protein
VQRADQREQAARSVVIDGDLVLEPSDKQVASLVMQGATALVDRLYA